MTTTTLYFSSCWTLLQHHTFLLSRFINKLVKRWGARREVQDLTIVLKFHSANRAFLSCQKRPIEVSTVVWSKNFIFHGKSFAPLLCVSSYRSNLTKKKYLIYILEAQRRSNLQTFFISFFVILILFFIYILQSFFRFTLSYVPYYLHIFTMTWAGRKNVGTFIN